MITQIVSLSPPSPSGRHLRALYQVAFKDWQHFWRYPLNNVIGYGHAAADLAFVPVYFLGQAFSVNGQARAFAAYSGTSDFISFVLLGTVLTNFIQSVFWGIGYAFKDRTWIPACSSRTG